MPQVDQEINLGASQIPVNLLVMAYVLSQVILIA